MSIAWTQPCVLLKVREMKLLKLVPVAMLALAAVTSQAWVVDFEDQTATSTNFSYPGGATLLNITVAGEQIDVYRTSQDDFDVTDNTTMGGMPAGWGTRTLAPFVDASIDDWFVFDMVTAPITEFSAQLGDYGGDSDLVEWEAYDGLGGTGNLVASGSVDYGASSLPEFVTVFATFNSDVSSILIRGGGSTFPNSLFIDNFSNQAVPEPATMTVLGLGALAAMRRRKNR